MRLGFNLGTSIPDGTQVVRVRIPRDDGMDLYDEMGKEALLVSRPGSSIELEIGGLIGFDFDESDGSRVIVRLRRRKPIRLLQLPSFELMPPDESWDFLSDQCLDFIDSALQLEGLEEDRQQRFVDDARHGMAVEAQVVARAGDTCEMTGESDAGSRYRGPLSLIPLRALDEGGALDPSNFVAVQPEVGEALRMGAITFTPEGAFVVIKALVDPELEDMLNPSGRFSAGRPGFTALSPANLEWHSRQVLFNSRTGIGW